jgi:hypothetical protein
MEPTPKLLPSLAGIEREVAAEGREWTRQRLQERLQQLADAQNRTTPVEILDALGTKIPFPIIR